MRYALNWTDAVVRAVRDVTPTVRSFEIAPAAGRALPFNPGAHIDVRVWSRETRSYSLVGEAQPDHYRIAVKRRPEFGRRLRLYLDVAAGSAAVDHRALDLLCDRL